MYKTPFNTGTLIIDKNEIRFEIPLDRINIHSLDKVERLNNFPYGFPIRLMELERNTRTFLMCFQPEVDYIPIKKFKNIATEEQKILFSKEVINLSNYLKENNDINSVLETRNIFVNREGKIKLLYRGIQGLMPAIGFNEEPLEIQAKRLILFMFSFAKLDELKSNGLNIAYNRSIQGWHEFVSNVLISNTFESLNKIVDEEFKRFNQELKVKKSNGNMSYIKYGNIDYKTQEKKLQKEEIEDGQVEKSQSKKSKQEKVKHKKSNFKPIGIGIGTVLAIWLGNVFINTDFFAKSTGNNSASKLMKKEDIEEHALKGLRYSSIQQYEDAIKEFEKVPYKSLDMEAKKSLLFAYLMTNNFQKALNKDTDFDESIVSYLLAKDRAKELEKLESKSDVIIFEQAVVRNDREVILKNYKKVKMNGRREGIVSNAFVGEEKYTEAFSFAQEHNNKELMKNIKKAEKEYYEKTEMNPDEKKVKIENLQKEIEEFK
ncbi:type VII secretion protein EssB/YukC [Bacillus cereus]|uniref:type VII secretion protein EssB/YukC n=1 Tax=Bacillus cereus TaxID=1396 RepID=UPI000279C96A|nr:type VII secretion protein EssB/YukC [Bacillus cereus]EJR92440.1 hypothetical protein IKG_05639 [Bacillus cereus VD200]